MQRTTQALAGITSICLGLMLCGRAYDTLGVVEPPERSDSPPKIETIRSISELSVLEVDASEIVTAQVKGYTGGTYVVVLVTGTLAYGIDLEQARYLQADEQQRHLVITLPKPRVRQVRIDPARCQLLSCERSGLWQLAIGPAHEDEAFLLAMSLAHDQLIEAASRDDLSTQAQQQAVTVLRRFVSETGWTTAIRWTE